MIARAVLWSQGSKVCGPLSCGLDFLDPTTQRISCTSTLGLVDFVQGLLLKDQGLQAVDDLNRIYLSVITEVNVLNSLA